MPSPPGPPIPLGNPIEWEVVFRDANQEPFDPSQIRIALSDPGGRIDSYSYPDDLTKKDTGTYSVRIIATRRGSWLGKGQGLLPDGTPVTTEEIEQRVF